VLYLLHGYTDHYPAWVSYTKITDYARGYEEIIVMPEGDNGFYTNNSANPKLAWEDFLILDLIPYVDSHYRTVATRQGRAVAGLSMGGYGAMKLGLKYPQLFAAAASLSGALASAQAEWEKSLKDEEIKKLLGGVFGPLDNPSRAANDLFELVKRISPDQLPQLYFSVGEDDRLLEDNRRFARLLSDLKIHYQYREVPGPHEWPVWDQQIQVVLALQAPVITATTASRP
jgi:S-formylglutathione hydrolase FrmB